MEGKKDNLRALIKQKRTSLSTEEVYTKSKAIETLLFGLDVFKSSRSILYYVSYDNEVYTHDMIKQCLAMGKTVVVPKSQTKKHTLTLYRIKQWTDLERGAYNILEPKQELSTEIDPHTLDLIIVPGVAFDTSGNRLGHGKGYYDRLLDITKEIPHIGLAFDFQIMDTTPMEDHDIPVEMIITESRIITCKSI